MEQGDKAGNERNGGEGKAAEILIAGLETLDTASGDCGMAKGKKRRAGELLSLAVLPLALSGERVRIELRSGNEVTGVVDEAHDDMR